MATRAVTAGLASLLVLALGGCGTVQNLRGGPTAAEAPTVYGGVRLDLEAAADCWGDSSGGHGGLPGRVCQVCVLAPYFLLIDLPLSFIGDTLTLPWTDGLAENTTPLPGRLPPLGSTSETDRISGRVPQGGFRSSLSGN